MDFLVLLNIAFIIGCFGISVYLLILLIKLSRRGIKALDIFIEKNRDQEKKL